MISVHRNKFVLNTFREDLGTSVNTVGDIFLTGSSWASWCTTLSRYSGSVLNGFVLGWKKWWLLRARRRSAAKRQHQVKIHQLDNEVTRYIHYWVYETGRQEKEDGKTLLCDKRDTAITCTLCRDLHLTAIFYGPLPKDLFTGKWGLAKSCFKQKYCHSCHTRFVVFFHLPSSCASSLLSRVGVKILLKHIFVILV